MVAIRDAELFGRTPGFGHLIQVLIAVVKSISTPIARQTAESSTLNQTCSNLKLVASGGAPLPMHHPHQPPIVYVYRREQLRLFSFLTFFQPKVKSSEQAYQRGSWARLVPQRLVERCLLLPISQRMRAAVGRREYWYDHFPYSCSAY